MNDRFWRAIETIHDVVYFLPEERRPYEPLGITGWWRGYFASRAAALGTPGAATVTAAFHGFAPSMVAKYVPAVWATATPADIIAARTEAARQIVAPALHAVDGHRLATALSAALEGVDWAGKVLAAAHAELPTPGDDAGRLWHAATALREYRGDCHIAVLTAAGLDGATANLLASATGLVPPGQQQVRGWSDDEWTRAADQLRQRGWTDEFGTVSDSGRAARAQLEAATGRVCAAGVNEETQARAIVLENDLVTVASAIIDALAMRYPNPTGAGSPLT